MLNEIKINGKKYQCHSYCEKDVSVGESIEVIVEGSFEPRKNRAILIERHGVKLSGSLVLFHNYGQIAKILLFVGD